MDQNERLDNLYKAWRQHIEDTPGHTLPKLEGGKAMHNRNLGATYIRCSACDWKYEIGEG